MPQRLHAGSPPDPKCRAPTRTIPVPGGTGSTPTAIVRTAAPTPANRVRPWTTCGSAAQPRIPPPREPRAFPLWTPTSRSCTEPPHQAARPHPIVDLHLLLKYAPSSSLTRLLNLHGKSRRLSSRRFENDFDKQLPGLARNSAYFQAKTTSGPPVKAAPKSTFGCEVTERQCLRCSRRRPNRPRT